MEHPSPGPTSIHTTSSLQMTGLGAAEGVIEGGGRRIAIG
jgi:hypothetical protein